MTLLDCSFYFFQLHFPRKYVDAESDLEELGYLSYVMKRNCTQIADQLLLRKLWFSGGIRKPKLRLSNSY
ncbi:hypothetical protein B5V46_03440 [Rhodovulum sp. MB263]|nr:hypothetical protein B5V46_03440 [Rhodovulum sp. MB263]